MVQSRVALVTGASGGIGGACALQLAAQGFAVAVHYHSHQSEAEAVVSQIQAAGGEAWLTSFDVTDPVAVENAVRGIVQDKGRLDCLVVTAGAVFNQMFGFTASEDLDRLYAINLRGAFLTAKAAAKHMLRGKWGRIIFLGSVVGEHGNAGQSAYAATKAGLVGLGKSLARELAPRQITVNVIAPGLIDTKMAQDLTNERQQAILQSIPMHRVGTPEDVAAAIGFLCTEEAGYITGAVLPVDGGLGA